MISFDDGYQDFVDEAWPVLQKNDFQAQVFIVTGLVGKNAEWDRGQGDVASLMDRTTITRLANEGVVFGSHLTSHRSPDGLSTQDLAYELIDSKACLEEWLGQPVDSFATPFGRSDERLRLLAHQCGYRLGFSTEPGAADLESNPLNLPRFEIRGDMELTDFVAILESCR